VVQVCQDFSQEVTELKKFYQTALPVKLCTDDPKEPFPIHIFTHEGTWITGEGSLLREDHESIWIGTDEQVKAGTSGSPIANDDGLLVGIVSNFLEAQPGETCNGLAPRPHLTAPAWLVRKMLRSEDDI